MKIQINIKDPDAVYCALDEHDLDSNDLPDVEETIYKFFEGGENISIEINTKTKQAKVLEVK